MISANSVLVDSYLETYPLTIVIVGPTASGKSSLAQDVARELDGEIISADSMQIYKGMDIGTAKTVVSDQQVPHHLLDILNPGEAYSAQQFQDQARSCIHTIATRNHVPILCGGTGFYIQAALENMQFPKGEQVNNPIREHWTNFLQSHTPQQLWDELQMRDAASAAVIHPNNTKRVIRALEMNAEGVSYAQQSANIRSLDTIVPSLKFGILHDREVLYQRINKRVDQMIEAGLVTEVTSLLRGGFRNALTAQQAIGYKEIVRYLDGNTTKQDAIDDIKQATRRYAKRQLSWFRRDNSIVWFDAACQDQKDMVATIVDAYKTAQQASLALP